MRASALKSDHVWVMADTVGGAVCSLVSCGVSTSSHTTNDRFALLLQVLE